MLPDEHWRSMAEGLARFQKGERIEQKVVD